MPKKGHKGSYGGYDPVSLPDEVWVPVQGFEGVYEVSNLARVKSVARKTLASNGKVFNLRGKLLRFGDAKGYPLVTLNTHGQMTNILLSVLVARHFISNPENKPQVNHKDGNTQNNLPSNLEWNTASENALHARRVLGKGIRDTHGMAKITSQDVPEIKRLRAAGETYVAIGKKYGMVHSAIRSIVIGKNWKGV